MKACTFFGHKDTPKEIYLSLRSAIIALIKDENIRKFYVGNQGAFDYMVRCILSELSEVHEIKYFVVLAYMPQENDNLINKIDNTIFPDGIESVPRRFAIDWRNRWMLKNSEYVVTYVEHSFGGAAKFKELAEKKNKKIINLAEKLL